MKYLLAFILLTLPKLSSALTIDEAGTQRTRKPTLTIEVSLENSNEVEAALKNVQSSIKPSSIQSMVFTGDLDGDGAPDLVVAMAAFLSKKGYDYYQAQSALSFAKTSCCQESSSGSDVSRLRILGDGAAMGIESDVGELSLTDYTITTVERRAGKAKYKNIVMKVVDPPEGLFESARKGWDGTVKGSVKISTDDGQRIEIPVSGTLSGVEMSLKEYNPAQDQLKSNPRH